MTPGEHDAAAARAAARAILDAPPFVTRARAPGLFQRIATDVGHWIVTAVDWVLHQLDRLIGHPVNHGAHAVFGGWAPLALALAAAVALGLVAALVAVHRRRADAARPGHEAPDRARRAARAARLLDEAAAARRAGDLDAAIRLRFEAGLERLEHRGLLGARASQTSASVSRQLASATFDELASVHSLVAYGGVAASSDDVERSFSSWPRVDDEARRAAAP